MTEMVVAYTLLKTDPGRDEELRKEITGLAGVLSAELIYGSYDVILKLEFKSTEELDEFIFESLRRMPGIRDTLTVITAKRRV